MWHWVSAVNQLQITDSFLCPTEDCPLPEDNGETLKCLRRKWLHQANTFERSLCLQHGEGRASVIEDRKWVGEKDLRFMMKDQSWGLHDWLGKEKITKWITYTTKVTSENGSGVSLEWCAGSGLMDWEFNRKERSRNPFMELFSRWELFNCVLGALTTMVYLLYHLIEQVCVNHFYCCYK